MARILDTVAEYLRDEDWNFETDDERGLIRCGVRAENGSFRLIFDCREDDERLLVFVFSPTDIPEDKRVAMAEYITRANYGIIIGNFEMDMRDGEMRYKISIDVEGGELVPRMVQNMLLAGVRMMDKFFPGMMAVCFGDKSPEHAIAEVRGL